jgi:Cu(I)/Ag(I) efflux system periplasmic protein CusF
MKHICSTVAAMSVALIATSSLPLIAQTVASPPAASAATEPPAAGSEMVAAEVRKVDKEGGRVTLKHGPIKNLDMPAMTMVFRVKDPALFAQLSEGASVNAAFEKSAGNYYVVKVEPIKK